MEARIPVKNNLEAKNVILEMNYDGDENIKAIRRKEIAELK